MALDPGTRLGPYEIVAAIGAGGMGEVYKVHDTRLERVVAIKVLPEHLAVSSERRERFEREAKAISQLNHPNICTLYDVGHQDGVDFLVMEYIDGETLADRLTKGPLPLDQALAYGIQITDGLDKAHRAGIVHRDLKPGNMMLTKLGVKLLDFGLAKPIENDTAGDGSDAPTRQKALTQDRAIVGTPQYMAPEQVEGKSVDARTDIFAFGAVVFEMLTGRKVFDGDSQASLVAAILTSEPPKVSTLRSSLPSSLDRTVAKCLAKDPDDRWQTARDLWDELGWIESGASVETTVDKDKPRRSAMVAVVVGVLAGMFAAGLAVWNTMSAPAPRPSLHFRESVPEGLEIRTMYSPPLVFSPDGDQLVLISGLALENHQLHLRSLDGFDWRELPETRGADMPFFSPDGQWLGYFSNGTLYKTSVVSGVRVAIADVQQLRAGATWGATEDDAIVFSAAGFGLMQVSANGGIPTALTTLAPGEERHWWPHFTPDGSAVLFTVLRADGYHPAVLDVDSGEYRVLEELGAGKVARYVPTGHIVYEARGQLYAAGFDAQRLVVTTAPVPVPGFDDVYVSPESGLAFFTISETGDFAYLAGTPGERGLVLVSRAGVSSPAFGARGNFRSPRFSPDETRVAVVEVLAVAGIWLYDVASSARSRVTTGGENGMPVWTSGGDRITFATNRYRSIHWQVVGTSVDEELYQSDKSFFRGGVVS